MRLLLLFLLLFSSLYAAISEFKHDDYQIILGDNFDDEAFDIIEDYDYNISLVGYTQDFKTGVKMAQSYTNAFDYLASTHANKGEQLRLIKLNGSAQIINDISFKLPEFNRGTNIIKNVHNGYLLGGYTHNGQMLISSLDDKGNQYYLKQFGTANFDQLHALISLKDGGSVAIGTSQTSRNSHDDMFVQGLGRNDVYLVKFKPNGQVRWTKKYGSTAKDIGVDGVATGDGGFIFIAIVQEGTYSSLVITKINDTGDVAWMQKFPKSGRNRAFKIIKTAHNNYLISASFENKNGQDNIRLIKIDEEGNTLWENNIFSEAEEHLNDISVDFKGNIIGVGYAQRQGVSDMDALVRYYDSNANMIWERHFGKDRQEAFKSVTLLHDNTFAIAGFSNSFADKGRQIWVIKLNDDGSLVKKNLQNSYKTLYQALKDEFKGDDDIHVYKDLRITHNGLLFKQGSSTLTSSHKAILNDLMPRLYKVITSYKHLIKNLQINGFTSTEWDAPDTERYLNNARLSNERALHILDYAYQLRPMDKYRTYASEVFSTDGYSYSRLIYANEKENKIRSRRVEFEIRLK
jgi:outer membrane protein OmpA-like peptidoglycan-associated protein